MKRWAALAVALYAIVLLLLTVPMLLCFGFDFDKETGWRQTFGAEQIHAVLVNWGYWLWLVVMLAGQVLLLLVPLDLTRERPIRRRRLWPTVMVAGFFMGNLVLAGIGCVLGVLFKDDGLGILAWPGVKSAELTEALPPLKAVFVGLGLKPSEDLFSVITIMAYIATFWAIWGLVFCRYAQADDPQGALNRATRWLLRGSALELLVAVPSHIIVRQRNDCCAPFATFWAITVGLSVMLLSFGPGVYFLFAKRIRSLKPPPGGGSEV